MYAHLFNVFNALGSHWLLAECPASTLAVKRGALSVQRIHTPTCLCTYIYLFVYCLYTNVSFLSVHFSVYK